MRKVGVLVACYGVFTHILNAMLKATDYGIPPPRVFYGTAFRVFNVLDEKGLASKLIIISLLITKG